MNRISAILMMAATLMLGITIQPALAKDGSYHEESKSYRVYLGVVPASLLEKEPGLVDQDKKLHGGAAEQSSTAQHVMVTVFRQDNNARVLNATVIARVGRGKVFGSGGVEKPLEKMVTSNAVAYANFFDMPEPGKYQIEVNIYDPRRSGSEKVRFVYGKY
ncbi:MAG: hypothetical protein ACYCZH_15160 [Sulfuriferula sp.]